MNRQKLPPAIVVIAPNAQGMIAIKRHGKTVMLVDANLAELHGTEILKAIEWSEQWNES